MRCVLIKACISINECSGTDEGEREREVVVVGSDGDGDGEQEGSADVGNDSATVGQPPLPACKSLFVSSTEFN